MTSRISPTDRLRQDAEEISTALDDFLKLRAAAVESQQEALNQYASEMQEIGQLDEGNLEQEATPELYADHNLRFHNSMNEGSGGEEEAVVKNDQDFKELSEFPFATETNTKKPKKRIIVKQAHTKMPTPEEKIGIRIQIFKFLEESREEAKALDAELEEARKIGDKQGFAALTKLCDAQRASFETLMDYLTLYQPAPFAKGMNNDPDYIALVTSINSKIEAKSNKTKSAKKKGEKP